MAITPYQYIISTGTVVADTGSILNGVQTEYLTTFGSDLILSSSTPQGVLIASDTVARSETVQNNAALANQINPNIAGGVFLDAICALTGLQRTIATPSLIQAVTLAGVPFSTIPAGVQAQTAAGDIFESLASVVLPASGTITVDFQSLATGAIPAAINALDEIVTEVLGWETVTNANAAIPGSATQSDASLRTLRLNTLALQGSALIYAIYSNVSIVPGVQSMFIAENYNPTPQGMLIDILAGTTLAGQIWGMTTTIGTGTNGAIIVDTDAMNFALSLQTLPAINPWPEANFSTTANIILSGLGTQGGGDWISGLTDGNIILAKNQTTANENGLWVAHSGAWTRQAYNVTASEILGSNQGISLVPNSIYTCINGGDSTDVATALLSSKSLGCAWNGTQIIDVIDPSSGQTYIVQFDRPTEVPVLVKATVHAPSAVADPTDDVINAILAYTTGQLPGEPGLVVGGNVSCFELSGAVNIAQPGIYVQNMQTTTDSSFSNAEIVIGKNEIATISEGNISVILI